MAHRPATAPTLRHLPRDFHEGKQLTAQRIAEEQVDDHHVFPRGYLKDTATVVHVDCVLNRTLIDKKPNIRIRDKAHRFYLSEMKSELSDQTLQQILASHGLPYHEDGPFFGDRFYEFLNWRQQHLARELADVTGWSL